MYLRVILISLLLPGCLGLSPALGGKTRYEVDFVDQVTDEGQLTTFNSKISAPAGVELDQISNAEYVWKDGQFKINGDSVVDSSKQAESIDFYNEQQMALIQQVITSTVGALAPFLGQYMDARVREGEIKADVAKEAISAIAPQR